MQTYMKTLVAAATVAMLPMTASAVTVGEDIFAGGSYTNVGELFPNDTLDFSFDVQEALDIETISIAATGTNGGLDLGAVTFSYNGGPSQSFGTINNFGGVGAAFSFIPGGGPFAAGDTVTISFLDGIVRKVGVTVSFDTAEIAPIPLPAAGLMLLTVLAGGTAVARRKAKTA